MEALGTNIATEHKSAVGQGHPIVKAKMSISKLLFVSLMSNMFPDLHDNLGSKSM